MNLVFEQEEINHFLRRINVTPAVISSEYLKEIVSGIIEYIPFQNVSMLTNEWVRPSEEMIKSDMLTGLGGLCTVRNPFLHEFLRELGFNVRFVSSTISEPDCHISIIVEIEGEEWWVDVGNGFPYFDPIRLGDKSTKENWFMSYRLENVGGRYFVYHKMNNSSWKMNHHFSPEPVDFSVFDHMHEQHYSVPGWGPFLIGLRINRFWEDGGAIVRNEQSTCPTGESLLDTVDKLESWLNEWFTAPGFLDNVDISSADEIWRRERSKWCNEDNC